MSVQKGYILEMWDLVDFAEHTSFYKNSIGFPI
jgi:hypothetical protein